MGGKRFLHKLNYKRFNVLRNAMYFHTVTIAEQNEKSFKGVASWENI